MIQKMGVALGIITLGITSVCAYNPPVGLDDKLDTTVEKIESIIDLRGDAYREKFLTTIDLYKTKYSSNERANYILNYLYRELTLEEEMGEENTERNSDVSADYMGAYEINNPTYGTEVSVTLSGDTRTMTANALPDHETGAFPNSGNPNSISAQTSNYSFPINPTFTGDQKWAREPGVAVSGVKFEPETAERVKCDSGETYKIEAIQNFANLGLDTENAHVQPTGAYHYHGISEAFVDTLEGDDLVHIGFALDGYKMYYSKKSTYSPSYSLSTTKREGTSCSYRDATVSVNGTSPDGTYVSDWKFDASKGDLDECNGIEIDGVYSYIVTDDYPYIGRCLNGEFTESSAGAGAGTGGPGGRMGPPPRR